MAARLTRRRFVASAAAVPFALRGLAETANAERTARWVMLGTDTGPGIFRCAWDGASGTLGEPELAVKAFQPQFLAMHPSLPRLYAVNSGSGAAAAVSGFHLDTHDGTLRLADRQASHGDGPCFVSVDRTGRSAFVANYGGGSLAAYELTVDGGLLPPTGTLYCKGSAACGVPGPVRDRQDGSYLHSAMIAPGNRFVVACDLGNDAVEVVAIYPGEANPLGGAQRFAARAGSGPRHVAFHPNGRWAYVMHELDCTLELFDWSEAGKRGALRRRDGTAVSTLPHGTAVGDNTGCEVLVGRSGRFVYGCTRGVDTLSVFRVVDMGTLVPQQTIACGGKTPRHMAFDATERWLLVANQAAPGSVTVFAHDAATGTLTGPVQTVSADTPMFIQFC